MVPEGLRPQQLYDMLLNASSSRTMVSGLNLAGLNNASIVALSYCSSVRFQHARVEEPCLTKLAGRH